MPITDLCYQRSCGKKWRYLKFLDNSALIILANASICSFMFLPYQPRTPPPISPPSLTRTLRRMFTTGLCSLLEGKQGWFLRVVAFHRWKVGVLHPVISFGLWPLWLFWLWQFPGDTVSMDVVDITRNSIPIQKTVKVLSPWCSGVIFPFASPLPLTYFSLIFWSVRTCLWLRALLLKCSFLASLLY